MSSDAPGPELLACIVEATAIACLVRGAGGRAWHASPGLKSLLGLPPDWSDWSDTDWRHRLHADDSFEFFDALAQLDNGEPFAQHALRLRHARGDWRRCQCTGSLRGDTSVLIFVDVTEVQQVEAALLDSQMRLRSLYDATPVAILLWSREGRITDMNRMAVETFGRPRDAAIGQKLVPLVIHPDDYGRFADSIKEALRDNSRQRVACRTLTANRELRCEWHSVPLRGTKGTLVGIMSLALDITAQAQAEESLRRSRDMAEMLSQAKTEFMATISHELRTPLNGMLGMAQLLETMPLGEEELGFVRTIQESGEQLLAIINAVVRYVEADTTHPEDCLEGFSLSHLLALVVDRYSIAAQQKGLSLTADIDDHLDGLVACDHRAMETIVGNLVDNAIRFTESGEVRLTARQETASGDIAMIRIDIADTGIGMSPDFVGQHLFTPFKQAENVIIRKHGGVGLGLALAKKLVDRFQGTIEVKSRENEGTTFTLWLPFRFLPPPL